MGTYGQTQAARIQCFEGRIPVNPFLAVHRHVSAFIGAILSCFLSGFAGGGNRDRTGDLLHAMQALSQLSYTPTQGRELYHRDVAHGPVLRALIVVRVCIFCPSRVMLSTIWPSIASRE